MSEQQGQRLLPAPATLAISAVTVDLDDTLYPQASFLAAAWERLGAVAAEHGLPAAEVQEALAEVAAEGSDRGTIIDRALLLVGVAPERLRLVVPPLVDAFTSFTPDRLDCYPGVLPALLRLRSRVPVACITDGTPAVQRAKLAALGLGDVFDAVVISDALGGRHLRKPHPAPFHAALARLGCGVEGTVHVGDRPSKDVDGTRRVGMRCVRVLTGEYAGELGGSASGASGAEPWLTVADFAAAVAAIEPLLPPRWREDVGQTER
jgi:HAD superfamily hydrolase (TIGR01509 family)